MTTTNETVTVSFTFPVRVKIADLDLPGRTKNALNGAYPDGYFSPEEDYPQRIARIPSISTKGIVWIGQELYRLYQYRPKPYSG